MNPPEQHFIDPNQRFQMMRQQQQQIYNTGAGYNTGYGYRGAPYQQMYQSTPQQQGPGIAGFGSARNQMYQGYGYGRQTSQPQYHNRIEHVEGYNPFGSPMLLPEGIEETCERLQIQMEVENEAAIAKRNARTQGYFNYNYGSNYYGWYNNYADQAVTDKYRRIAEEIREEAKNRRVELNKRLSRLAHKICGDPMSEEETDRLYEGYNVTITASEQEDNRQYSYLASLQEVDTSIAYRQHFDQVRNFYNKVYETQGVTDMNSWLAAQGILTIYDNMEKEVHKRRDLTQFYDKASYRRLLRKSIMERDGIKETEEEHTASYLPFFQNMNQSAKMLEDGTLSISAPNWVGGKSESFNNTLEAHFEENRNRFLQSIFADSHGT